MFDQSIVCCYLHPITKYGYPPAARETGKHLQEMADLGFKSVELEGVRREHLLAIYENRYEIKDKVDDLSLAVPYFCTVLPGLSSPNSVDRASNLRLFEKGCEIAELLGSKGVVDNGPLPPYQFVADIPVARHYDAEVLRGASLPADLDWEQYWRSLVETFQAVCDTAAKYDLTYNVHPCLGVLSATSDGFLYFCQAVGRENLRFVFDTANQFCMEENLNLALQRLAKHIDYIHLSDNRGGKIEHLVPGKGRIHWPSFFETVVRVGFAGDFGVDVGGAESGIDDIDSAYVQAARWLEERI